MAIYFDLGGPLGQFIDDASGFFVGLLRVLLPPALIGCGVLLIRSGGDKEREGDDFRTITGAVVVLVALAGFCHLFGGQPSLNADDRVANLSDAGGLLGVAVAGPLESIAWIYGATIVLAAVAFFGAVMFIGIPVRDAVAILRRSVAPIGTGIAGAFQSLFTLGRDRDAEHDDDEDDDEFDEDETIDLRDAPSTPRYLYALRPRKRRRRRRGRRRGRGPCGRGDTTRTTAEEDRRRHRSAARGRAHATRHRPRSRARGVTVEVAADVAAQTLGDARGRHGRVSANGATNSSVRSPSTACRPVSSTWSSARR